MFFSFWVGHLGCTRPPLAPAAAKADAPAAIAPQRLHVLMINGGGTREQNYQSHLLHVQHLTEMMFSAGVASNHITVFSSDGNDPEPDVAMREPQVEKGFWMLEGTPVEQALRSPVTFIDSSVNGISLRPATTDALRSWFEETGKQLGSDDTLLLYVTDHGTKNTEDLTNNHIVLWGKDAKLSVHDLRQMLATLSPGVRVVTLMSQCFSGAFANLMDAGASTQAVGSPSPTADPSEASEAPAAEPRGNVCGYFSSTADRPAYGCYPENRGRNNVGHSFHFLEALASTSSLSEAHRQVLIADGTPDVPLRTSDEYLTRIIHRAAGTSDEARAQLVDTLLQEAWGNKQAWEPEIRLLDRIGAQYGTFSPRSLAEIDAQAKQLPDISTQMKNTSRAWRGALADANEANFGRFLDKNESWRSELSPDSLNKITNDQRQPLVKRLVGDVRTFTAADAPTNERLRSLRRNGRNAAAASYRMEVRLGVILRMRKILISVAGRQYLATRATAAEKEAYANLRSCEDLTLPPVRLSAPPLKPLEPFPPFEEDVRRAQAALPSWMGIQFREPKTELVAERNLKPGAAAVITVYPDSPAEVAGVEQGDIITGPPGQPFTERGQVRSWIMLSKVGEPRVLDVLRGEQTMKITLVPRPFPLKWPELPGPPKVGSAAPPLSITPYRGDLPKLLARSGPRLLFFWATWCGPCKASVPEVLAFEREMKIPVIAITDESTSQLDTFFKSITFDFPANVGMDDYRKSFVAYGVSGTPTFVWIDEGGKVRSQTTGYQVDKGLQLEGWKWKR